MEETRAAKASQNLRWARSFGLSMEVGSGCHSRIQGLRQRVAWRAISAARAALRLRAASCIQALNQTTIAGASPRSTLWRTTLFSTRRSSDVLPAPQGALIAIVSGVAVSSPSIRRASPSAISP
jgi:hypothetical protein